MRILNLGLTTSPSALFILLWKGSCDAVLFFQVSHRVMRDFPLRNFQATVGIGLVACLGLPRKVQR